MVTLTIALSALGQTTTAPATQPKGLDALSDDRVYGELASRGLETLLERAFEANNVPQEQREGIRTLVALRELSNPNSKFSPRQRQEIVQRVVKGIEQALPAMTDPRVLMQQATTLIRYGVERDVNALEYWGENPRTQAGLRPIAETVVKILDKAAKEAQRQSDTLANQIQSLDDPKMQQAEELITLATSAEYTRAMAEYYRVLAMDSAYPKRAEIAEKAVEYLKTFDTQSSDVQPVVRLRMAKMLMLIGEHDRAEELFSSVVDGKEIVPQPTPAMQYEARYFSAVNDVLARKPDAARKKLEDLLPWQKANLPKEGRAQDGASAAAAMLDYRINLLESDLATAPAEKKQASDRAVAILLALVKEQPELQGIIFEQLANKMPATGPGDLRSLDTLLLQALVRKGDDERLKPADEPFDKRAVETAIAAAREMIARKNQPSADPSRAVDEQFAETAALLIPFLQDKLGRKALAVEGFLDYIKTFPASRKNGQLALDNALALVAQLRKTAPDDPATLRAYEQFLPIAINPPFNRVEFAYEWARRLQSLGRYKEAAEYFQKVPADDSRKLAARFYEMVALQQRLDYEQMEPAAQKQIVNQIQQLAEQVQSEAEKRLAAANNDQDKLRYRSLLVRTTLLSADIARREQDNPQRTLDLLSNFEQQAQGLPNEQELLSSVLFSRVQAHMALGQNSDATATLVQLLKTKSGGEGAAIVYNLLEKLNDDLDRAREAGNIDEMRSLASNRAILSGFLVDWAKNNEDPNVNRYTYRYSVFDAATKQLAAELEQDPARKKEGLNHALELYTALQSPENVQLYKQTIDPKSGEDPDYPDPQVSLGIGLIQYELGNYAEAQQTLGQLLTDRKLGSAFVTSQAEDGSIQTAENDRYWEATLKLLKSNMALAQRDEAQNELITESENYLKRLYIRWGDQVGGQKWGNAFAALREELMPEFEIPNLGAPVQAAGS